MRKRMIERDNREVERTEHHWLNLENLARVEMTSEDEAHPVESALVPGSGSGWRASESGEQTLRLLFDEPRKIALIRLLFQENKQERTQEFVLRWSTDGGQSYHDIARQQYNFSLPDSTRELEDYGVDLDGVTALELCMIPDISGGSARASLAEWRIA
ncbi:MAG: hypothetical protein Q9M27_05680 [Mariprofundaceae bacterium]|nr:hypothetical protein [Mariprofundaceae bacterium]